MTILKPFGLLPIFPARIARNGEDVGASVSIRISSLTSRYIQIDGGVDCHAKTDGRTILAERDTGTTLSRMQIIHFTRTAPRLGCGTSSAQAQATTGCPSKVKIPYVDLDLPQRHFRELLEMVRISSSRVSVAVREILFKKIDGASKNNNFQKKVYQKIFICRGDILISKAKKSDISL